MLAFERESMQAAVPAIGYDQQGWLYASIDPQAVWAIELVVAFSESAKTADELSFLVVLIDEARSVSIADIDIAIRSDGHVGWSINNGRSSIFRLVGVRFCRIAQSEYLFAF